MKNSLAKSSFAKSLLASCAVIALGATAVSAADIPMRQTAPTTAPVYVASPVYNWSGMYAGVAGGGGWGTSNFGGATYDVDGGLFSGTLGYNFQTGPLVVGLEGDIGYSNIRGSGGCGFTNCDTANKWLGTVRGRLGYAAGNYMPYVTGGWAFGERRYLGDRRGQRQRHTLGLDARRRPRGRGRRTVDRQGRISLRRSRPRQRRCRIRCELQDQHRPRGRELSLLDAARTGHQTQKPRIAPGLFFMNAATNQGVTLVAANDGTCAANLSCQASRRGYSFRHVPAKRRSR